MNKRAQPARPIDSDKIEHDEAADDLDTGFDELLAQTALLIEGELTESDEAPPAKGAQKPSARQSKRGDKERGSLGQISSDRPIFTLSVAADLLGLHPRTLRIYEDKKLIAPARTGGNRRRYSQNDIRRFNDIRRLTQGGVNLEGARIILEMSEELLRLGGDPNEIIDRNLLYTENG